MAVTITEHQCRRALPGLHWTVTAVLPAAIASSAFGPRLQAAISRRDVVELCRDAVSPQPHA